MLKGNEKFYITTPIYYSNEAPHIGSAYTTIAADILARYHRVLGKKVFFLTGTDEHGTKIAQAAEEAGKDPQQFCDEISEKFKHAWKILNISNDNFIRTTDPKHKEVVQKVLQQLFDKDLIKKGEYEGLYCVGCEKYLTEKDLVDGKCPDHKKEPELLKEESYFFKLSNFQQTLLDKIKNNELIIEPQNRRNEIIKFIEGGLDDVAVSRAKVKWGVKLPFDESHTTYVWIDAFLNYLTGLGWNGNPKELSEFWPPDVQLMAKDIIRVHATIWCGLLLALDIPLPKKIFVHGFFTVDGQKMSKSLGNVINPIELAQKYGTDVLRYFLFREIPFGQDGDFSQKRFEERYDADLAKGLGNLLSRVLSLAEKTGLKTESFVVEKIKESDFQLKIDKTQQNYHRALEEFKFNNALASIWELISFCDEYIEKEKLWDKSENQKTNILYLLYTIGNVANLLKPFLPETSEKILKQLGLKEKESEWIFNIKKSESLFPKLNSF